MKADPPEAGDVDPAPPETPAPQDSTPRSDEDPNGWDESWLPSWLTSAGTRPRGPGRLAVGGDDLVAAELLAADLRAVDRLAADLVAARLAAAVVPVALPEEPEVTAPDPVPTAIPAVVEQVLVDVVPDATATAERLLGLGQDEEGDRPRVRRVATPPTSARGRSRWLVVPALLLLAGLVVGVSLWMSSAGRPGTSAALRDAAVGAGGRAGTDASGVTAAALLTATATDGPSAGTSSAPLVQPADLARRVAPLLPRTAASPTAVASPSAAVVPAPVTDQPPGSAVGDPADPGASDDGPAGCSSTTATTTDSTTDPTDTTIDPTDTATPTATDSAVDPGGASETSQPTSTETAAVTTPATETTAAPETTGEVTPTGTGTCDG